MSNESKATSDSEKIMEMQTYVVRVCLRVNTNCSKKVFITHLNMDYLKLLTNCWYQCPYKTVKHYRQTVCPTGARVCA